MLNKTFSLASTRKNETLYCIISGRIDSSNSSEFLQGLMDDKNNISHKNLELDLKELEYISSSGLRGLLTLQKEEPNKVRLTNVSEGIYRTLEITGFTRIFDTHRIPREFDVTPYKEITRGSTGVIYRIDEDTILKLYPPGKDISFAEDEKRLAQIALVSGVPTAIPYEIVSCNGGYGVLFELLKADTVADVIMRAETDEEVKHWGRKLGKLLKDIHAAEANTFETQSLKDIYISRLRTLTDYLTPEQMDTVITALQRVPDVTTMLHGDFHVQNIMLQGDEFILIDMVDVGYGHPIFDLSMNYISSRSTPDETPRVIGLSSERAIMVWEAMVGEYFHTEDKEVIEKKMLMMRAFSCPRLMLFPAFIPNGTEEFKRHFFNRGLELLPDFVEVTKHIDEFLS